jgi:hypothetical protein
MKMMMGIMLTDKIKPHQYQYGGTDDTGKIFYVTSQLVANKRQQQTYYYSAEHMRQPADEGDAGRFCEAPAFLTANSQYRQPVIGYNGMKQADQETSN